VLFVSKWVENKGLLKFTTKFNSGVYLALMLKVKSYANDNAVQSRASGGIIKLPSLFGVHHVALAGL
jgi:hypothetical protein